MKPESPSILRHALWLIETFLILLPLFALGILPRKISIRAGESLGSLLHFIFKDKKRIALKNIEIACSGGLDLPASPEDTVRSHFSNLGRSIAEVSMLMLGRRALLKDIVFEGIKEYEEAMSQGQGVILITGHCGNWELTSFAKAWRSLPSSSIARPLNNPYLNRCIEHLRTRYGNKVINKRGALKEILSVLNKGGSVGILMDQSVVENEAVIVEFFGEKVYAMKSPALLAMKTGAKVIPIFINYLGNGRHRLKCYKEIPVRRTGDKEDDVVFNTQAFTKQIENYIKENPSEWLWIHRRFKYSHGRRY
jgi:KDO2-lipid IV(A) lauroyltransferase